MTGLLKLAGIAILALIALVVIIEIVAIIFGIVTSAVQMAISLLLLGVVLYLGYLLVQAVL